MARFSAQWRCVVALGAACLLLWPLVLTDGETHEWLWTHHAAPLDVLSDEVSAFGDDATPAAVAGVLLLLGVALDRPRLRRTAVTALLAACLAGAIVLIVKPIVGRQDALVFRPRDPQANWLERHWGHFPSGHSAIAFSLAASIGRAFPPVAPALYALATLVGLSRVYEGAHLLSDVCAGALVGLLAAWLLGRWRREPADAELRPARPPSTSTRAVAAVVALSVPLVFLRLGSWGFFDPDEGRYAAIPAEMLARHDFVTPTLDYVNYFEKPPLTYWAVAATYALFGFREWAARLVPALASLLGLLTIFALGRRMFSLRVGLLSALILATSVLWAMQARFLGTDMLLSALIFLSLALWWRGHTERDGRAAAWFSASWIALALAVLTKGPVAAVLVLGTIGVYGVLCGQLRSVFQRSALFTAPLLLLVAVPWFVLVAQRNPEFNRIFWYEQHVGRFLGLEHHSEHGQPFVFFLEFLPALFFPWSLFVPSAIAVGWRLVWPPRSERQRALVFLMSGAAVVVLFFSISSGKLLPYVLPAMPLLALPLAVYFDRLWDLREAAFGRPLRSGVMLVVGVLALAGAAALWAAPAALRDIEHRGPAIGLVMVALLLAWAAGVLVAARRRRVGLLVGYVAGGFVALVVATSLFAPAITPNHYCRSLLVAIKPGLRRGAELVAYDSYLPSMGFYAGRRLVAIDGYNELDPGVAQLSADDRERWFPEGLDAARAALERPEPVYCFVRDHERALELMPLLGNGVQEIVWNKRRSIVANRAAAALTPPRPGLEAGPLDDRRIR